MDDKAGFEVEIEESITVLTGTGAGSSTTSTVISVCDNAGKGN